MDDITHEFVGSVRPYRDRPDISVPVLWYKAPPSAKLMPYANAFANVVPYERDFVPLVGVNFDFTPVNMGNFLGRLGQAPCGSPDQWINGCLATDTINCKCKSEDVVPVEEVPTGLIDGSNRNFTLSQTPMSAMSLLVFLNGVAQTQVVNYSIASNRISFTGASTPRVGDSLLAYYWVQT